MPNVGEMPLPREPSKSRFEPLTEKEVVKQIQNLVWDDPAAFFTLEAECLSITPIGMEPGIRQTLRKMKLLNHNGRPPATVKRLMLILAENMSKSLASIAACD